MIKKTLFVLLSLAVGGAVAGQQSSQPTNKEYGGSAHTAQNNPLAGSRQQSSEQQFGTPKVKGTKGQKYNYADDSQNNPLAGSHQQSSEQQFGTPKVTNKSKDRGAKTSQRVNKPTVGGRQSSSDQLFGNPGNPTND
ncbi:MAG: hypothetical protein QG673_1576 [Pseudomonadota bacterium]|nr:hypothetical protein [Pseudomonadota bacterium]